MLASYDLNSKPELTTITHLIKNDQAKSFLQNNNYNSIRQKRSNQGDRELTFGHSFERECLQETCSFEEAFEWFKLIEKRPYKENEEKSLEKLYGNSIEQTEIQQRTARSHALAFQQVANQSCSNLSPLIKTGLLSNVSIEQNNDRFCNKIGIKWCQQSYLRRTCVCKDLFEGTFCEKCSENCTKNGQCFYSNNKDKSLKPTCRCNKVTVRNFATNETTIEDRAATFSKGKDSSTNKKLYCNKNINECKINQILRKPLHKCKNSAICIDTFEGYMCKCPTHKVTGQPLYSGAYCQNDVDECRQLLEASPLNQTQTQTSIACSNHGKCINSHGSYSCQCDSLWTGYKCDRRICLNNGFQENIDGNSICRCPTGFKGSHCEEDINECEIDNICNHGDCENLEPGYICHCHNHWQGRNCKNMNCENGGVSKRKFDPETEDYNLVCECPTVSRFNISGKYCEYKTCSKFWTGSNCATIICQNGRRDWETESCIDLPYGWTGRFGETKDCNGGGLLANGTCDCSNLEEVFNRSVHYPLDEHCYEYEGGIISWGITIFLIFSCIFWCCIYIFHTVKDCRYPEDQDPVKLEKDPDFIRFLYDHEFGHARSFETLKDVGLESDSICGGENENENEGDTEEQKITNSHSNSLNCSQDDLQIGNSTSKDKLLPTLPVSELVKQRSCIQFDLSHMNKIEDSPEKSPIKNKNSTYIYLPDKDAKSAAINKPPKKAAILKSGDRILTKQRTFSEKADLLKDHIEKDVTGIRRLSMLNPSEMVGSNVEIVANYQKNRDFDWEEGMK